MVCLIKMFVLLLLGGCCIFFEYYDYMSFIIFLSVRGFFIILMVTFTEQKFRILIKIQPSNFSFMDCAIGIVFMNLW